MPLDKTCPTGCGSNGKTCESECYPVYDPNNTTDGIFQLMQLTLRDTSDGAPDLVTTPIGQRPPIDTRSPVDRNDPSTPRKNENEIDTFVSSKVAVKRGRPDGIFRNNEAPYKWFVWERSEAARIAFNGFDPNIHAMLASIGITLSVAEVMALAKCPELQLSIYDVACKGSLCPAEMDDRTFTDGTYFFTGDPARLGQMIDVLENENITIEMSAERRQAVADHLSALKGRSEEPNDQWWKSGLLSFVTLGGLFYFLHWKSERAAQRRHAEQMEGKKVENALETYTRNLTEAAKKGELKPYIGKLDFLYEIIKVVVRREKPNPLITAEKGRGKTTAAEGLAQVLADGRIDPKLIERFPELKNAELRLVNLLQMVGGTNRRGDFEARWVALIAEVKQLRKNGRNIWLVIDEAHHMVTAGAADGIPGLGDTAKNDFLNSGIPFIAMTTTGEVVIIMRDPALGSRFVELKMPDASLADVIEIVQNKLLLDANHYKIKVSAGVAERLMEGAPKLISDVRRYATDMVQGLTSWFTFKYLDAKVLEPRHVDEWLQERPPQADVGAPEFDPLASLRSGRSVSLEDIMRLSTAVLLDPSDTSVEAMRVRRAVEDAQEALRRVEEARRSLLDVKKLGEKPKER